MHLRYFETFAAVVDQGSFSKAADVRHLTQSAVSQQVKELEGWLGQP
ncbi:MAG: LysR family transcriptional regulator, partial [Cyanobacteria bacterium REEB65]|nr:LysR family transcriptional regulator [Cyanobacteria bacterium REEB65]